MNDLIKNTLFDSKDIEREFALAEKSCQMYFDRMYKTLEFSFVAIIAVVGICFGFGDMDAAERFAPIICLYILPACMYVFGAMYIYNGYALAVSGRSAEILHRKLYENKASQQLAFDKVMRNYVMTRPLLTKLAYGICTIFYLATPLGSILFGVLAFKGLDYLWIHGVIAFALYVIYLVFMLIIVKEIKTDMRQTQHWQENQQS